MKFAIKARHGFKRNCGFIEMENEGIIKLTLFTLNKNDVYPKKVYYELLKTINNYYSVEFVEADKTSRSPGVVFDKKDNELFDIVMADPTFKELKKKILDTGKKDLEYRKRTRPRYYKRKNNKCIDCGTSIHDYATRCRTCYNIYKVQQNENKRWKLDGTRKKRGTVDSGHGTDGEVRDTPSVL